MTILDPFITTDEYSSRQILPSVIPQENNIQVLLRQSPQML